MKGNTIRRALPALLLAALLPLTVLAAEPPLTAKERAQVQKYADEARRGCEEGAQRRIKERAQENPSTAVLQQVDVITKNYCACAGKAVTEVATPQMFRHGTADQMKEATMSHIWGCLATAFKQDFNSLCAVWMPDIAAGAPGGVISPKSQDAICSCTRPAFDKLDAETMEEAMRETQADIALTKAGELPDRNANPLSIVGPLQECAAQELFGPLLAKQPPPPPATPLQAARAMRLGEATLMGLRYAIRKGMDEGDEKATPALLGCAERIDVAPYEALYAQFLQEQFTPQEVAVTYAFYNSPAGRTANRLALAKYEPWTQSGPPATKDENTAAMVFMLTSAGKKIVRGQLMESPEIKTLVQDKLGPELEQCREQEK